MPSPVLASLSANPECMARTIVSRPSDVECIIGNDSHAKRWTSIGRVRETFFEVVLDLCRAAGLACARISGDRDQCHSDDCGTERAKVRDDDGSLW